MSIADRDIGSLTPRPNINMNCPRGACAGRLWWSAKGEKVSVDRMKLGGPAGRVKVAKSLHWRPKTAAMQLVVGGRGDGLGLWVGLVGGRGQEKVRPTLVVMMWGGRFCHLTLPVSE